jgi:hypothetical protein
MRLRVNLTLQAQLEVGVALLQLLLMVPEFGTTSYMSYLFLGGAANTTEAIRDIPSIPTIVLVMVMVLDWTVL